MTLGFRVATLWASRDSRNTKVMNSILIVVVVVVSLGLSELLDQDRISSLMVPGTCGVRGTELCGGTSSK